MILERHHFTGYWLPSTPEARAHDDSAEHARRHLEHARAALDDVALEGHIVTGYEPKALPDNPGYAWLRERLGEITAREPAFDAEPELHAGQAPVYERRDPFPALFWRGRDAQGRRAWLEILVGRDTVVLHQAAAAQSERADLERMRAELDAARWLSPPAPGEALFTGSFVQVSQAEDDPGASLLAPFGRRVTTLAPEEGAAQAELGLALFDPRGHVSGALVSALRPEPTAHADPWEVHDETGRVLTRLTTAFVNARKVAWEHGVARGLFGQLAADQERARVRLDDLRSRHRHVLAPPLSYAEVEELRHHHQSLRRAHEDADKLFDTCRWNANQCEDVCRQILGADQLWAQATLIGLRRQIDQLDSFCQSSRRRVESLTHDIELEIAAGSRAVSSLHARELMRFDTAPAAEHDDFLPLVVSGSAAPADVPWHVPGGPPCEVRWPKGIGPEQDEDLERLYLGILQECSAGELSALTAALCATDGCIRLARGGAGGCGAAPPSSEHVSLPVGALFALDPRAGTDVLEALCDAARGLPEASAQSSPDERGQATGAFACLLTLLDAVTGFLARPAPHLATLAARSAGARVRLLTLAGFLRLASGDEARGREALHAAAQAALAQGDFDWAFVVAQLSSRFDTRASQSTPAADEGRARLAREFLRVFDLAAAVQVASCPAGRPLRPARNWLGPALRALAVAVGAGLLAADWWLAHGAPLAWRHGLLWASASLAVAGAPLALALASTRAGRHRLPHQHKPRLQGAVANAVLTFGTTDQTATLVALGGPALTVLSLCAGLGGFVWLSLEVRETVSAAHAPLRRCADVFALTFLQAVCVTAVTLLGYQRLLEKIYLETAPGLAAALHARSDPFFFHPAAVLSIATLSLFAGIVLQLMFDADDPRAPHVSAERPRG